MQLVSYLNEGRDQLALLVDQKLYDMDRLHGDLPGSMGMFLNYWDDVVPLATVIEQKIRKDHFKNDIALSIDEVELLAPVPHPTSCRDGYAFRQHVAAARRNRKVDMIPEFDQYPIFYFTNHNSIQGPGNIYCMPDHFEKLDFELEAAIVINKPGRNIKAADADDYIAGLMIMNDMSARRLQMEEMLLNLGPAKGKDFSTAIGPKLVTLDELAAFEVSCKEGHTGKAWNLSMKCFVNGLQVSEGNVADMDWTFAEIIERASYGVTLMPGDIIGSGTVGTGCFLELNGTGKLNNPNYAEQWLKENDVVELEIDALGKLTNTIVKEENEFSLLAIKKNVK
ncbi:MAG TPA: fumarylacetoacetate hydrolase family protein [Ferruginibacter sp.]|nr:fumarylacetoacetate hydrolase family protein [Bacteroidota bacterium]MBS1926918.1 fumarylacetoacetate hydrolase family protein [Bacteroidota bacterium]HMT95764.1 fumarylacetoacetate hydrolase family protein [Ferruginibacter sp.]HMU23488.1 fumarylacetoacetate hydrolase family protein [Ferruginibacter sp.]